MTREEAMVIDSMIETVALYGADVNQVVEHVITYVNELIEQYGGQAYDCGVRDGREGLA